MSCICKIIIFVLNRMPTTHFKIAETAMWLSMFHYPLASYFVVPSCSNYFQWMGGQGGRQASLALTLRDKGVMLSEYVQMCVTTVLLTSILTLTCVQITSRMDNLDF